MSLNFNHKAGGQIEESGYKYMRYHLLVEMHSGTEVLKIRQKRDVTFGRAFYGLKQIASSEKVHGAALDELKLTN